MGNSVKKTNSFFITAFLAILFGSIFIQAEVRYVCPRLEGVLFSGCQSGAVHYEQPPQPEPPPPIVCTGVCYLPQFSLFPYNYVIAGQPAYPGDTRMVCPGGETPGTPCTDTYSNEGVFLGCLGGTGPSCPGSYVPEIIPGTERPATPNSCGRTSMSCTTSFRPIPNSSMFGTCACGPTGASAPPPIPACNVPPDACTIP